MDFQEDQWGREEEAEYLRLFLKVYFPDYQTDQEIMMAIPLQGTEGHVRKATISLPVRGEDKNKSGANRDRQSRDRFKKELEE